jgi:PAS domain S-box-containing protein
MFRFRSYRSKLQTAFVALALAAIGVTGWDASQGAAGALREATYARLTAIRETKRRQIERYFEDVRNHVLALSTDESAIAAIEEFTRAWDELPLTAAGSPRYAQLETYYREAVAPPAAAAPQPFVEQWLPADPRTLTLQYHFLAANPNPIGTKDLLLTAPETGPYSRVHARYHPTLHRYQSAFGCYDIFLIGAREGRILYSVFKEIDLGASLASAPYDTTTLARAFEGAMAFEEPEQAAIVDYQPYVASYLAPAAFVAAPVWRAGAKIGVLAIQLSIDEINRVMTGDRKWSEEGLGQTGQAYIVGPDGTLRSDFRFELEQPGEFYSSLERAGVAGEVVERIRRNRTAVLNLPLSAEVVQLARSGGRGTGIGGDLRGVPVLRSHSPLEVPGLDWALIAEIEAEEALAPVRSLQTRILGAGAIVALVFLAASWFLARSVTRPVQALAAGAKRLGGGDFATRIAVETSDEIGQLADSFNRMAEDLERTTVTRDELDRMLGSMINAVFVIGSGPGAGVAELLDAPVRQGNPAALHLLGYSGKDFSGQPFRRLLPAGAKDWEGLLERLLRDGRLPAVETALATRPGRPIPVLFTAAVLAAGAGTRAGIVCAAQDITEWKAAQDQLRRLSKVFMDSADPIVVADLDGRIADSNAEAERLYGWRREELARRSLLSLAPRSRQDQWGDLLARCRQGAWIRNVETVQINRFDQPIPVLITLSLLTGEDGRPAGIAAIAKDITERKLAEQALRQKQRELEALAGRLIAAQEEERSRLARELHDDLTQRLAAVAIEAGRLERVPATDQERWREGLERIKRQTAQISHDIHGLSRRLHPSTLDDLGLIAAIESECRGFFERGGPPVEFDHRGEFGSVPKDAQLGLYRIVQEGLRNIYRHADASEVSIRLERSHSTIDLEIRDAGRGFDRHAPGWRAGLGLASMEERARLLGGRFSVESQPGQGTRIAVSLPFGDAL